jgi:Protein of unknown function (DUF3179)
MRKLNYPILIVLSLAVALFCLAYPMYVIRPFRHQESIELAVALGVLQIQPIVTVLATLAAVLGLVLYWRLHPRLIRRIAATVAVLVVCASVPLSRVNMFEIMFHPMGAPAFEAALATKLDGKEMVIGVNIGGDARAYPTRIMAYHHITNDTVGGVPIERVQSRTLERAPRYCRTIQMGADGCRWWHLACVG